jgi:hypothetical protein
VGVGGGVVGAGDGAAVDVAVGGVTGVPPWQPAIKHTQTIKLTQDRPIFSITRLP